jgi:transposase
MIEAAGQDSDEVARLRALVAAQAAALKTAQAEAAAAKAGLLVKSLEIEKLKIQIARLRRMQFGRSSEKLSHEIEQLELRLEELEMVEAANNAAIDEIAPAADAATAKPKATRRPLPEHLPRIEIVHTPAIVNDPACACPSCGTAGKWRKVDEDVREVLEYVPGRFEVIRHVRPAFSCRTCESMAQAPMPSMPIERGMAGPGLIAQVLVGKYCDHLPLYRQAEIFAREGVEIERSVMAGWVAKAAELVAPLVEAVGAHVMRAERLHADDTPVPVLAPGLGCARRQGGSGCICAMSDPVAVKTRPPRCIATRPTARESDRASTSRPLQDSCRRMPMPDSTNSMRRVPRVQPPQPRLPAGRTSGATSTTFTPGQARPWHWRR